MVFRARTVAGQIGCFTELYHGGQVAFVRVHIREGNEKRCLPARFALLSSHWSSLKPFIKILCSKCKESLVMRGLISVSNVSSGRIDSISNGAKCDRFSDS